MPFVIVEPRDKEASRKIFIDGEQSEKDNYPKYMDVIRILENATLERIYREIDRIESLDLPHFILPNKPKKEGTFRRRNEDLENEARNWYQLDLDWTDKKINFNELTLDERVSYAVNALPFLSCGSDENRAHTGMVAHLSNKAGMPTYANRVSLRLYILLSEPMSEDELKSLFKPYVGKGVGSLDACMYERGRIHLVRAPKLTNTKRNVGETLKLYPGPLLDVNELRNNPDYRKGVNSAPRNSTFEAVCYGKEIDPDLKERLVELAKEGFFEEDRHLQHFKLIASAVWKRQNAEPIIQLILDTPEVLGTKRGEKELRSQLETVHRYNHDFFISDVWNQIEPHSLTKVSEYDLKDADLTDFWTPLENNNFKSVVVCKSPHGSAKTTALVPAMEERLKKTLGKKEIRTLYVSALRSVISSASSDLSMACYIKNGDICEMTIDTADRLGICIFSLHRVANNKPYDLVVFDEAEAMLSWSEWNNKNHGLILDVAQQATTCLLIDADASDLCMSFAKEISSRQNFSIDVLLNDKSYIHRQTLTMLERPIDFYGKLNDLLLKGDEIIWVNVDFADKEHRPRLSIMAQTYNDIHGPNTMVVFDSKQNKPPQEMLDNPTDYIDKLIENGTRAIVSSPVFISGIRYKKLRFTATCSSYEYGITTAPSIIQSIQRCIGVNNHYAYVAFNCHYLKLDDLERIYVDEYYQKKEKDQPTNILFIDTFKDEIKKQALVKKERQKSNIRAHLFEEWRENGGKWIDQPSEYTHEETNKNGERVYVPNDDVAWFTELAKTFKEQEKQKLIEELLADRTKADKLLWHFEETKTRKQASYSALQEADYDEIYDLVDRYYRAKINTEEAEELIHLLTHTEADHRLWDMYEPPWTHDHKGFIAKGFHAEIGMLMKRLFARIFGVEEFTTKEMRQIYKREPIVYLVDQLNDAQLTKIKTQLKDVLPTRLSYYKRGITNDTLARVILRDIFDYKIRSFQGEVGEDRYSKMSLPEIKKILVNLYIQNGLIKKTKNPRINEGVLFCKKHIWKKINQRKDLDPIEKAYLERTNYLVVAEPNDLTCKRNIDKIIPRIVDKTDLLEPVIEVV